MRFQNLFAFLIGILPVANAQQKSESKAYEARYGVKTGSTVKIVETDKGTSKVYDAKYGAKSGSATQIIETEKNGVSKVYDAK